MTRPLCAALLVLSGFASVARAQNEPPAGGMPAPAESAPPGGMPAPAESGPPAAGRRRPGRAAGRARRGAPRTSASLICRTASRRGCDGSPCPAWLLNVFTKKNVPLSSWGTGIEFFRRKANFDLVLSFSYQNMSPPAGELAGQGPRCGGRHRLRRVQQPRDAGASTSRSSGTRSSTSGSASTTAPASARLGARRHPAHQQRRRSAPSRTPATSTSATRSGVDAERLQHAAAAAVADDARTTTPDTPQTRTSSSTRTSRPCCRSSTSWSASTSGCPRCAAGRPGSRAASTTPSSWAAPSATRSDDGPVC